MNTQKVGDINNSFVNNVNHIDEGNKRGRDFPKEERFSWSYPIIVLLIINIFFMVFNIIVLIFVFPRSQKLSFDYLGVVVTIYSIIVMLLICWNVYNVIDLRKMKSDFDMKKKEVDEQLDNLKYGTLLSRGQIEEDFVKMFGKSGTDFPEVIPHSIKAIYCWSEIRQYNKASKCVDFLLAFVTYPDKIKYDSKEKEEIMDLLKSIPNQSKIRNIEKVYLLISSLGNNVK